MVAVQRIEQSFEWKRMLWRDGYLMRRSAKVDEEDDWRKHVRYRGIWKDVLWPAEVS